MPLVAMALVLIVLELVDAIEKAALSIGHRNGFGDGRARRFGSRQKT